jgi:hypothetical protein
MKLMMRSGLVLILTLVIACSAFSQAPAVQAAQAAPNRIPQQIVVNGQQVNGAYVPSSNGMQSFTCPSPQEYATPDGASRGWACFDQSTSVWLLNALPPASAAQQPTVVNQGTSTAVVQQPAAAVVYGAPYPYPVVGPYYYGPSLFIGGGLFFGSYPRYFGGFRGVGFRGFGRRR